MEGGREGERRERGREGEGGRERGREERDGREKHQ